MSLELVAVGSEDIDAIHGLFRRWEAHWEVPMATSAEEIHDNLTGPHLMPDLDVRGIWSGDRLVAVGAVYHSPSGVRQERVFLEGRVDPACRGCGLGRRLLAWQVERGVEKLRACDPSLPWFVRTNEYEWVTDAHHLYTRFGMMPVRWFEELIRPLSDPLSAPVPEEVEILPWVEVPSEEARQVSNASFADHWESTPRDSEAWEHMLSATSNRTDLSFVAVQEGRVIGICLNAHFPRDQEVTGRRDGWILHLGVLEDRRRMGVASALIDRSLEAFREAGFSHAMLGVDADSPTGASGLYRRLGFQPLTRSIMSELQIRPDRSRA